MSDKILQKTPVQQLGNPAMIYIVAGTAEQANRWIRSNGMTPAYTRYVHSPRVLRGIERGSKYIRVGTWYEHRDIPEIDEMLTNLQAVELSVSSTGGPGR